MNLTAHLQYINDKILSILPSYKAIYSVQEIQFIHQNQETEQDTAILREIYHQY
jgi:hypothetical protein